MLSVALSRCHPHQWVTGEKAMEGVCLCMCVAEATIPGYYPIPYLVIKMNITLPMRGQPQEWTHTCDCSAHICCMHIYVYTNILLPLLFHVSMTQS